MRTVLRLVPVFVLVLAAASPAAGQTTPAWRVAAEQRIERHRKGTLHVVVRDAAGQPVPNAPVHVAMQRHAFGFGTALVAGLLRSNTTYRAKLADLTGDGRTFNLAVFGNDLKWPDWQRNTNKARLITDVAWLGARGMDVRGHNLLWPAWQWMPDDMEQRKDDPAHLRNRIETHIRDIAGYRGLKGVLREWDVVNEPVHLTELRDALKGTPGYTTGEEIYAEAFQWAAEADPEAHLWINEYNIIAHYASQQSTRNQYKAVIQRLLDAGAPLYGIGFQGHISPGDPTSPENVFRALNEFDDFGTRLAVTEYDYAYPTNNSSTCRKADEAQAGTYLRDFLTVVFSHPAVESFTIWGFWDGDHWRCDAALFRNDWSLKPSGEAYLDLVFDAWWTDETVTTDANGEAVLRGFLGDYEVTATLPDTTVTRTLSLASTDTTRLVLSRTATAVEGGASLPVAVVLEGAYPNPFNPSTTIRYALPTAAPVRLDVYDALGQHVARLVDAVEGAGWHTAAFDGGTLPSGVYFYRLTTGDAARTGRMLLVK